MKNDFDRVAKFYQHLSHLVFGNALIEAQVFNLGNIKAGDQILWVGGGNGELFDFFPRVTDLKIDFVERSEEMLRLAQNRSINLDVNFIKNDILDHEGQYDVVIANFFLDCFSKDSMLSILDHLKSLLKSEAILLVTDFDVPSSKKDRLLLWVMHKFFGHFSNLEAQSLLPISNLITNNGFEIKELKQWKSPTVFSAKYMLAN